MNTGKVILLQRRLLRRAVLCGMGVLGLLHVGQTSGMALSIFLSFLVYAWAFGMAFGIGLIALLFIHEFGHILASRLIGLGAAKPLFIPFLGAVVRLNRAPGNAKAEANVAIGGPAAGTVSALICLIIYLWTDSFFFLVLAYSACLLNLFNLIPCDPLDGGRIVTAISPHMWWVGGGITGLIGWFSGNVVVMIIFFFSLFRLWYADDLSADYYRLTLEQRLSVGCCYFALLLVLGFATLFAMDRLY